MTRAGVPIPPMVTSRAAEPRLLFTAFEPSGDDHASAVIAELRKRYPNLPIFGWGGRKMEAAGATLVERTGDDAVMGVPGFQKIIEHGKINRRVDEWLEDHPITVHIPVDSPAANFPLCALTKARGIRVVHLVAPQMWAWGSWRLAKLRRLTDLVLCLLPFEESWFMSRGVPARFIGHPLFDRPLDYATIDARLAANPGTFQPALHRIAMMPGSRPKELKTTLGPLLDAFRKFRADFPDTAGLMAITRPEIEPQLRRQARDLGGWPEGLEFVIGDVAGAVRWATMALVKSGTVTLHVTRQQKPMITFYRPDWLAYQLLGRWLVSAPHYTLPNLIAGKRVVPELIPYFSDSGDDLYRGLLRIVRQPGFADEQRAALEGVCRKFEGKQASVLAADAIEQMAGLVPTRTGEALAV
jgi:lipid-A-disaccharide synthase